MIEKAVGDEIDFCDLCTEFTRITPGKKLLIRSVERANIIEYRFNEGNKTRRIRNNNKIRIDPNHKNNNTMSVVATDSIHDIGGF